VRGRFFWAVHLIFIFGFYFAYVLALAAFVYGILILDLTFAKCISILTCYRACTRTKFILFARLLQYAFVFFLTPIYVYVSLTIMKLLGTSKLALLEGTNIIIMVLLFFFAFSFYLTPTIIIWLRTIVFCRGVTFHWTGTIAKLDP
jgi:hypothetical protein